jgi:hypothetical protein
VHAEATGAGAKARPPILLAQTGADLGAGAGDRVAIENVAAAINQIAQTTLRKVVGQHTLDETLSETDVINVSIREILDVATIEWGVVVTLVELKDIQLPESRKRAMARQAETEREKRAKIIAAEGEALAATALGTASDTMMAHPLALQLRNLQSLVEIGVDKNTTVVFPAPLMSTIGELGAFLSREAAAVPTPTPAIVTSPAQDPHPTERPSPPVSRPLPPASSPRAAEWTTNCPTPHLRSGVGSGQSPDQRCRQVRDRTLGSNEAGVRRAEVRPITNCEQRSVLMHGR